MRINTMPHLKILEKLADVENRRAVLPGGDSRNQGSWWMQEGWTRVSLIYFLADALSVL